MSPSLEIEKERTRLGREAKEAGQASSPSHLEKNASIDVASHVLKSSAATPVSPCPLPSATATIQNPPFELEFLADVTVLARLLEETRLEVCESDWDAESSSP